ncbi:MAG TPA: short-chain dehydrogenase [Chitinophagaceae bacterium]|nr:short-chain dehydrogenase [Chitinophagaceae bacterium]
MFSLQGKNAVVTGAGSGIGKAIALCLAQQGAAVYVADLNEAQASTVVITIKDKGGIGNSLVFNVADQQEVAAALQPLAIDILVNCAGISHIGNAENTNEADFDRVFQVNVKGTYNCIQAVLPAMKAKQQGVIINISSIAAKVGLQDRFAYSMSKGAVYAMTLSVAKDYLPYNIRCNCISPARVHTPFVDGFLAKNYPGRETEMFEKLSKSQPIGRMGTPDEMAALVLYLCSNEASFITGSDFPIDGGFVTLNN